MIQEDMIRNALNEIYKYAKQQEEAENIIKLIAIEYCYNSIAIECELDTRMWLHKVEPASTWQVDLLTREEYYYYITMY